MLLISASKGKAQFTEILQREGGWEGRCPIVLYGAPYYSGGKGVGDLLGLSFQQ